MSTTALDLHTILPEESSYPAALKTGTAFKTAPTLTAIGNLDLLSQKSIAFFCSRQCPDDLILKTYDLAQSLRDAKILVISGFHTPIEQDCLKILLGGTQSIIHCPARSLHKIRLSSEQKTAIGKHRLLLLSPFNAVYSRVTAELSAKRNEMIGAIAHTSFIAYAAPNSKTLAFAQRLIEAGKAVITLSSSSHTDLQEQSIPRLDADAIVRHCLEA